MAKETLEEVAKERLINHNLPIDEDFGEGYIAGAILGAKWQQEQEKQEQDCFYEKALFLLENSPNNINTKKQLISWFKLLKNK